MNFGPRKGQERAKKNNFPWTFPRDRLSISLLRLFRNILSRTIRHLLSIDMIFSTIFNRDFLPLLILVLAQSSV